MTPEEAEKAKRAAELVAGLVERTRIAAPPRRQIVKPETVLRIWIDSREQRPLDFRDYRDVVTVRRCLKEGDYATEEVLNLARLARKSLTDLEGSMIGENKARVEREWGRLRAYPYRAIVVEATFDQVLAGSGWARIHPNSRLGILAAWWVRYGLPVVFAGSPDGAAAFAYRWFRRIVLDEREKSGRGSDETRAAAEQVIPGAPTTTTPPEATNE